MHPCGGTVHTIGARLCSRGWAWCDFTKKRDETAGRAIYVPYFWTPLSWFGRPCEEVHRRLLHTMVSTLPAQAELPFSIIDGQAKCFGFRLLHVMVFTMGTEKSTGNRTTATSSRNDNHRQSKSKWPIRVVFRFHLFSLKFFSYQIRFGFATNSLSGWRKSVLELFLLVRSFFFSFFSFFFLLFFHRVDA
ncbi:unnamed protein product [Ectocarpus sp. 8 AP-2014]